MATPDFTEAEIVRVFSALADGLMLAEQAMAKLQTGMEMAEDLHRRMKPTRHTGPTKIQTPAAPATGVLHTVAPEPFDTLREADAPPSRT